MLRLIVTTISVLIGCLSCHAGMIESGGFATAGVRWDAVPQTIGGVERSLAGGIRYSIQGGDFQVFRDRFRWDSTPSVTSFQQAVEQSFSAWTLVDPVSRFGTSLSFVPDLGTSVVGNGFGSVNYLGAEIDLFGFDALDGGTRAMTALLFSAQEVTLTSGVANYANTGVIAGVDITINNNSGAVYSLDVFRRLLTHEIGHAIGLGDVDLGGTQFIDDNFSSSNPVETLNNSWAHLVNPLDPANSPGLSTFNIPPSVFQTTGVDLLMESNGLGISPGNPLSNLFPLTNDEYGMRQFLYPSVTAVPEPSSMGLLVVALLSLRVPSLVARRNPSKA